MSMTLFTSSYRKLTVKKRATEKYENFNNFSVYKFYGKFNNFSVYKFQSKIEFVHWRSSDGTLYI